jgi:EAL domain-containing protein (putative c-di-GMP-specific phosphodiesterase class I)
MVTTALAESGMPPQKLQLEITETVLLQNTARHAARAAQDGRADRA